MREGINCGITKAEEQMSNPEDRILEISGTKQNPEKRMKRTHSQETSETTLRVPKFKLNRPQQKKKKRKDLRKHLKIQSKNSLTWERKQSPKSRKCKESHTAKSKKQHKTHIS